MKNIFKTKYAKDYIFWCRKIGVLTDLQLPIDSDTQYAYNMALINYRQFLEDSDIPPVKKLIRYDEHDQRTWKYLRIYTRKDKYLGCLENKDFVLPKNSTERIYVKVKQQRK